MKRWCLRGGLAFALMFLAGTNARALTIGKTNLVSLIRDSNSILERDGNGNQLLPSWHRPTESPCAR